MAVWIGGKQPDGFRPFVLCLQQSSGGLKGAAGRSPGVGGGGLRRCRCLRRLERLINPAQAEVGLGPLDE